MPDRFAAGRGRREAAGGDGATGGIAPIPRCGHRPRWSPAALASAQLHSMSRAERSRVGRSDTDHAERTQLSAHEKATTAAFAGVSSIDLVTKAWAAVALTEPVRIADGLCPMLRRGAGMLLGPVPVSAGNRVCVGAAAGRLAWRAPRSCSGPVSAGRLAVMPAGVTGNAIGWARGAVVDFIGLGPITCDEWPVANAADLALVAGGLAPGWFPVRARAHRAHRPFRGPAPFPPAGGAGYRRKAPSAPDAPP